MKALKKTYRYYKSQNDGIPLFRVQNEYLAVFEDAGRISKALHTVLTEVDGIPTCSVSSNKVFDVLALLHDQNISAYLVSCRNECGEFDFPDIEKLEEERRSDY